ncbi:hypothetical protein D6C97_06486 [Aureobasidium pullulans]|nr:hypothetical protein D6C97_06486 [Aureobasidium pullulans]
MDLSPTATPRVVWSVQMHKVLRIALVVRREPLTITLSVEGYTNLKNIVHYYCMRVTKFCIQGGCEGAQVLVLTKGEGSNDQIYHAVRVVVV